MVFRRWLFLAVCTGLVGWLAGERDMSWLLFLDTRGSCEGGGLRERRFFRGGGEGERGKREGRRSLLWRERKRLMFFGSIGIQCSCDCQLETLVYGSVGLPQVAVRLPFACNAVLIADLFFDEVESNLEFRKALFHLNS